MTGGAATEAIRVNGPAADAARSTTYSGASLACQVTFTVFGALAVTVMPMGTGGTGLSQAFVTTNAKSWSKAAPFPGTPSPAMFAAVTVTVKGPLVPGGRNTLSRLFFRSGAPSGF